MLIHEYIEYKEKQQWKSAANHPIIIIGQGYIKLDPNIAIMTKIYYAPELIDNVMAVTDLQNTGHEIIFPANQGKGTGALIRNIKTDEIVYRTTDDYMIDLQIECEQHDNMNNENEHNIQNKNKIRTVRSRLHSNEDRTIKQKVADIQRRFGYPSKSAMKNLQQNIEGFPINKKQINKYYTEFPWFSMGRMTKSSYNDKQNSKLPRNIGDIVATDDVPIKTYGANFESLHLFIDALSGFCTIIFGHKTDGSKELASHTERVRKQYERYGHIIKTLQTDSLSAYQAAPFEENLIRTGIQRRESTPNEHEQNGQVERYVRSMEEQISSMRAAAPWVPKKFITFQILLWAQIWNLQSGVHTH